MLDQTINDLTLALRELTAAVQTLVALQPSATPGAPAAFAAVAADAAPITAEHAAPITAEHAAPITAEHAAPITPEALRALCIRAGQAGHTAYVVNFLRTHGVRMLSDLPAKYCAELVESLTARGVN